MRIRLVIGSLIALVGVAPALGETSLGTAFTYHGQLKEGGVPLEDTADFEFTLWDDAGGGDPPIGGVQVGGVQAIDALPVTAGLFTVTLNPGGEFGGQAFNGNARWLQIAVRSPAGSGGFTTLAPRQPLTAVPYALHSLGPWQTSGANLSYTAGNVGIGTSSPQGRLDVLGVDNSYLRMDNTYGDLHFNGGSDGVLGIFNDGVPGGRTTFVSQGVERLVITNAGNVGIGTITPMATLDVHSTSGSTVGVVGQSNITVGIGVLGYASAATGTTYGVYGLSESTTFAAAGVRGVNLSTGQVIGVEGIGTGGDSGTGVAGRASATGGYFEAFGPPGGPFSRSGVYAVGDDYGVQAYGGRQAGILGSATGPSGTTYGGRFESASTSGRGVYGLATSDTGTTYGGWFQSYSTDGRGVYGQASAHSGLTYGVYGQNDSTEGRGVYGLVNAGVGMTYGVLGQSWSTSGRGVYGLALATSGTPYGVLGSATTLSDGYGVFADGDMGASGVKPFRIDHPDDPENKYLLHYAAESPEVINFYSGKAMLDGAGEAVVELPHYFAKINKDPRYTLTAVGAPMPMLHVAEEIDEAALSIGATAGPGVPAPVCSFHIAGGAPGAKVSWRVEALRNDLWVQARSGPVESLRDGVSIESRAMPVEVEKQGLEKGKYQHPELYGQPAEMGMNYHAVQGRPSPVVPQETMPD